MRRIESTLGPRPFIPAETDYYDRNFKIEKLPNRSWKEEREKYEQQWALSDRVKAAAATSIAKDEASITQLIAGLRKAELYTRISNHQ